MLYTSVVCIYAVSNQLPAANRRVALCYDFLLLVRRAQSATAASNADRRCWHSVHAIHRSTCSCIGRSCWHSAILAGSSTGFYRSRFSCRRSPCPPKPFPASVRCHVSLSVRTCREASPASIGSEKSRDCCTAPRCCARVLYWRRVSGIDIYIAVRFCPNDGRCLLACAHSVVAAQFVSHCDSESELISSSTKTSTAIESSWSSVGRLSNL